MLSLEEVFGGLLTMQRPSESQGKYGNPTIPEFLTVVAKTHQRVMWVRWAREDERDHTAYVYTREDGNRVASTLLNWGYVVGVVRGDADGYRVKWRES